MTTKKTTHVTRKFLLGLANDIYDPQTRRFLRRCRGTLQNGPDPIDGKRTMHCGLGELYFAMTGKQPEQTGVGESDVVDLAVELSALNGAGSKVRERAVTGIKALKLPPSLEEELLQDIKDLDDEELTAESEFRRVLDGIPGTNDSAGSCGVGGDCSYTAYRSRSAQVAKKLREAAALLPA
jgi:hypothetical protein